MNLKTRPERREVIIKLGAQRPFQHSMLTWREAGALAEDVETLMQRVRELEGALTILRAAKHSTVYNRAQEFFEQFPELAKA